MYEGTGGCVMHEGQVGVSCMRVDVARRGQVGVSCMRGQVGVSFMRVCHV